MEFTRYDIQQLQKLYNKAIQENKPNNTVITYKGAQFVLSYLKYLLLYINKGENSV